MRGITTALLPLLAATTGCEMSLMQQIADFFVKDAEPQPEGRYALSLYGQYYTGRAHAGEVILNPDPEMACLMKLEQAVYKRNSNRYFSDFQIVPIGSIR